MCEAAPPRPRETPDIGYVMNPYPAKDPRASPHGEARARTKKAPAPCNEGREPFCRAPAQFPADTDAADARPNGIEYTDGRPPASGR
ncbi:hypothetical protein YDYSY3_15700 [Paenibacillus chitinolyticus]|nr:hypothetical protein YDYSY3_15700 [Paenibacillus chitinolyticus]